MGLFLYLGIMLSGYRSNPPFIYRCYLVGGLEHEFYFPFSWECHHPNCYSLIFFRGVVFTTLVVMVIEW